MQPTTYPVKVAIVGRAKDTANYENALRQMGAQSLTSMDVKSLSAFHGLLLPGGGDIAPAFFGQKNQGSRNIDIELDVSQFQALELFLKWKRPVFGVCKGMQVINVCLGGSILQHIPEAACHAWDNGDKFHPTNIRPDSFLAKLYGDRLLTNSAHHQAVDSLGQGLSVIQTAGDNVVEGIAHDSLPVFGVQWHPERLFPGFARQTPQGQQAADGRILFRYFLSLCASL